MEHSTLELQIEIPAERFVLRPPKLSDVGPLDMHLGDERVAKMTREFAHPLPPGATESYISRSLDAKHPEDVWVMDGSSTGMGEVLGAVGLERMDRGQAEIAFWVVPCLWGTGIATEAVKAILAANPLACDTVFAAVFQDNPASAKMLTNLDFLYLGDAEYHSVARGAQVLTWTYVKKMK